jgi:hypothetical protein
MSNHHHEGDSKSFILPVFLSFAIVFCLFVLMSRCSGPYHPVSAHGGGEHNKTEQHSEHNAEEHKEAVEHKEADTSAHKAVDTAAHKTAAHGEEHH